MGLQPDTVSRWENRKESIGPIGDRLLRLMVEMKAPMRGFSIESLANLAEESDQVRLFSAVDTNGWHELPA